MQTPIAILNWNGWEDTKKAVDSITQHVSSALFWIFDNNSERDRFEELFGTGNKHIKYVKLDQNYGFAGGINRIMRLASEEGYPIVYSINNDCFVTNDFLTPIVELSDRNPQCAIVASRYLSMNNAGEYKDWGYHSEPEQEGMYKNGLLITDRIVGCGMLLRVKPFWEVEGMDERFFCYGEENDLCYKLQKRNYHVGMCYNSLIYHRHRGSDVNGNHLYYTIRNKYLLQDLHPQIGSFMPVMRTMIYTAMANRKNTDKFIACIEGIHHGRRRRFGKRPPHSSKILISTLFYYYYLLNTPSRLIYVAKTAIAKIGKFFINTR